MRADVVNVLELRSVRGIGGGPDKTILLGAERADRTRVAITVCYIRDARDDGFGIGEPASRSNVDYVEIVERHSLDPGILAPLRRLVRDRGIDIVHAHDYKTDVLALILARLERIVPLATVHGWSGHSRREGLYYAMDKRLLRAFPLVIAVCTEWRAELLRHRVHADRVRVVLNSIDHSAYRRDRALEPAVRAELGLRLDDVVVGAVGRLEIEKRYDLLIEACAALRARGLPVCLVIVGTGSLSNALGQLACARLPADAYRPLGHRADVVRLHHAFDVFVQSSANEGTSNAVLEAMALETPIVATDVGGTAELAHDQVHGLLVPRLDVAALTAAIERTIVDRAATERRVAAARRRIETALSFDRRVATLDRIYIELARQFPRRIGRRVSEQCA